mgnify:CR=1 FL=1
MDEENVIDRVRHVLEHHGSACRLDELLGLFPELTWHQVLSALDQLRQAGQIDLSSDARKMDWVEMHRSVT